jgi:hypothetical protein
MDPKQSTANSACVAVVSGLSVWVNSSLSSLQLFRNHSSRRSSACFIDVQGNGTDTRKTSVLLLTHKVLLPFHRPVVFSLCTVQRDANLHERPTPQTKRDEHRQTGKKK